MIFLKYKYINSKYKYIKDMRKQSDFLKIFEVRNKVEIKLMIKE